MSFTATGLRRAIEDKWLVGEPTSGRLSVTGEPYVIIGWQISNPPSNGPGTVDEGHASVTDSNEAEAYRTALTCFERYAAGKIGKIYWRTPPQLHKVNGEYRFSMRCLISDKEPMVAAA